MDLTSNEPFWLVKNGLVYAYPSLKENIETDILIVGGGITGALMANQCIEDGYKTTLIDRREIANGSSSATTSMLQYEIDTPLYKLIEMIGKEGAEANYWAGIESIKTLGEIVKKIKSDCGFEVKESLFYAAFKKDLPDLIKEFEARKAAGFEVTWLEEEEIEKKYNLHQTHGGILSKKGGSIDAFRFVHDLLQYNLQKGLAVFDKTNTESTTYKKDKVIVTTDYGNTITANKVIYCNGYESTEMIKEKFVDLLSSYVIISEPMENIPKNIHNTLFWDTAEPYIYLRTTDDNRLLIGGEDEDFKDPIKRDQLLSAKSEKLKKKIDKLFPDLNFRTDFKWAGTFGETKDGLPYIGEHPDFKNSYFLLGFGGNGITFSVTGTKVISDMLHGKQHPLAKYFRFKRD